MMRTVGAILEAKSVKDVVAVSPSATVFDVAELMSSHNVGCALVRDGAGRLVGIFSERDLMKRVVAASLDPRTVRIEDVMTSSVRRIPSGLTVEDAVSLMIVHSHRHM
ncbi:MAG TPA: CBS domain-containing protein, partial [Casimicrobiaceae bacterium]|nr:CBS domain-containing protein [Casimicrobiaceae bacterium]